MAHSISLPVGSRSVHPAQRVIEIGDMDVYNYKVVYC